MQSKSLEKKLSGRRHMTTIAMDERHYINNPGERAFCRRAERRAERRFNRAVCRDETVQYLEENTLWLHPTWILIFP